jgi:hypothetical protein
MGSNGIGSNMREAWLSGTTRSTRKASAAHDLSMSKHITMNLVRLDPVARKGGINERWSITATSDECRTHQFGFPWFLFVVLA